ncbi:helicase associated domain-containing protein [Streptomyces xinghaiensis]|uniref:helicase associated domain-containing protein n=1 Tax=Streptomyces xinghaiensis TaxID=1038928 RepID=UPI003F4D25D5
MNHDSKELLDAPEAGMVWEPGEEAWETKLAAPRSYRQATGHLAPRQDVLWDDPADGRQVPIGRHLANLRRKGGLGKNPQRARRRAQQLEAVDPDWNCPWPLDWKRHYRVLADLADADGSGILNRDPARGDGRRRRPGTLDAPTGAFLGRAVAGAATAVRAGHGTG